MKSDYDVIFSRGALSFYYLDIVSICSSARYQCGVSIDWNVRYRIVDIFVYSVPSMREARVYLAYLSNNLFDNA